MIHSSWIRKALLISVLAGVVLEIGCGGSDRDGKYQDSAGAVTLELKGGKVSLNYGGLHLDGTYTLDGDKITIRPTAGETSQTMVLTINSDGSIDGPPGSDITKLRKAK